MKELKKFTPPDLNRLYSLAGGPGNRKVTQGVVELTEIFWGSALEKGFTSYVEKVAPEPAPKAKAKAKAKVKAEPLKRVRPAPKAETPPDPPEVSDPNMGAVVEATGLIIRMGKDLDDSNKPTVYALSDLVGFAVSTPMRDEAYEVWQTENGE